MNSAIRLIEAIAKLIASFAWPVAIVVGVRLVVHEHPYAAITNRTPPDKTTAAKTNASRPEITDGEAFMQVVAGPGFEPGQAEPTVLQPSTLCRLTCVDEPD